MTLRFVCLLALLFPAVLQSAPLQDLVDYLPDYGPPPTTQFSGYLDGSEGCDTEVNGPQCMLHYWLALAQDDPWDAPVVLWLNGGPGSSSILGFLQENGPLLINATGGLMDNPWSWTKIANVLILEAPVGVGYSYCSKQFAGQVCQNTDRFTASTSRAALVDFFYKFPELAPNDFFITGESYAGIYIPTLAQSILNYAPDMNLVGIAVGDPCTDNTAQADSMDQLWYSGKYGLIDEAVFDTLWNKCGIRSPSIQARGGHFKTAAALNKLMQEAKPKNVEEKRRLAHRLLAETKTTVIAGGVEPDNLSKECSLAMRKFWWSSSHALSQGWGDLYIDDYSLFAPVTSKEDEDMATYMMRADVRQALHTEQAPTATWPGVDIGFDYTSEYDACNVNVTQDISMIDIYREIAPKLKIAWVYNGDTDVSLYLIASLSSSLTCDTALCLLRRNQNSHQESWFRRGGWWRIPSLVLFSRRISAICACRKGPSLWAQSLGSRCGCANGWSRGRL